MRVLVACEYSGIVRDAFLKAGHDAISCDLLPTESPGPHIQGDVTELLQEPWELVIAHPPCTYLANSGVRWLHERPGRWEKMREGAEFFRKCLSANSPRVCVENPIIHKHARLPHYTQRIQPWQFGHGEMKAVCLWLKGLPPLFDTRVVTGRIQRTFLEPPSKDRSKLRSRFFEGIAAAMADQWSD